MDKKTVADDALISTDIDRLIKYLSAKKRIEMNALAREMGMKTNMLKKWISILEDEGYVKVEYKLLNEFAVWAGEEVSNSEKEGEMTVRKETQEFYAQPSYPPKKEETPVQQEVKEEREKIGFKRIEVEPKHEEFKAEERVERIMERIGAKEPKKIDEDVAASVISRFSEEKSDEDLAHEEKIIEEAFGSKKEIHLPYSHKAEKETAKPDVGALESKKAEGEKLKADEEMASLKRSIAEYIDEIKVRKEDIEKLKAEREKLLTEGYLPLENRFKAAYDEIVERLLEKEGKIMELKERLMAMPEKVGEIDKIEAALKRIRNESRRIMYSNKAEMEELKKSLKAEDERLKAEIDAIEDEAKAKKAEVMDIFHSISQIEGKEQEIKKDLDELNKQVGEINEAVATSYASLSQLSQARTDLARRLENVKITLEARSEEARQSFAKLQDVKKTEGLIEEYLNDYKKKVDDIEAYVKEGEAELGKLREFAEVKYIRGYLKELESLSSNYEQELEAVDAQKKSIDERIAEARESLNRLLMESRELVKSLEKKTSDKDFEKLAEKVKRKQQEMVATVREKAGELEKMKGEANIPEARETKKEKKGKEGKKKKK